MNRTQRAIKRNARFNQSLYREDKNVGISQLRSNPFGREDTRSSLARAIDGEKDARICARNSKLQTRNYTKELVEA